MFNDSSFSNGVMRRDPFRLIADTGASLVLRFCIIESLAHCPQLINLFTYFLPKPNKAL